LKSKGDIPDVYIGDNKIHFYAGGNGEARIWLDDSTKGIGLLFIMKWPDRIMKHTVPRD
jgi:hypothetical protein